MLLKISIVKMRQTMIFIYEMHCSCFSEFLLSEVSELYQYAEYLASMNK